jgi:hypothetical protein
VVHDTDDEIRKTQRRPLLFAVLSGAAAGVLIGAIVARLVRIDTNDLSDQSRRLLERVVRAADHVRVGTGWA